MVSISAVVPSRSTCAANVRCSPKRSGAKSVRLVRPLDRPSFDQSPSDSIGSRPISPTLIKMAHHDVDKTGTCRMCAETALLEKGHVIPAFVYRWLEDTSATGYLRGATNPNVCVQDGLRRYWFCRSCERMMGRFERAFAANLFPLIVQGAPAPYPHGPWLSRFLAFVVLRVAMLHAEHDGVFDYFTPGQRALVPQALSRWRVRAWRGRDAWGPRSPFTPHGFSGSC
jgi:hypothetical protein